MEIITKILDKYIDIPFNHFVFDIETTGLSSKFCKVILIGVLYNENNQTIIKQYFAKTEDDEKDLLIAFQNDIKNFDKHITFNGYTFDIPFLNTRFEKHKIDFSLNKSDDVDILKLIKPFKEKLSLSDCKLKTIEKYLGIYREDTISGKESVELYKKFVSTKCDELKEKILLHNYEDIYYLGQIFKIKDILEEKLNPLIIKTDNIFIKLIPLSFKITNSKLTIKYLNFNDYNLTINLYEDNYSIISEKEYLYLNVNIIKGQDKDNNIILYYNLSKIIPLKFNDSLLEQNIYSLCNYLIKKELSLL